MQVRLFITLLLALWLPVVQAEKTLDLFSATRLVVNQTAAVRHTAAAEGLAAVFVRLSGTRQVLKHPSVREALARASDYLYEYSYQSTESSITLAGRQYPATALTMKFTQAPLEQLLRRAQLPLWSANRADVLLWSAVNQRGHAYLPADLSALLARAAADRGIPLIEPVLDLADRKALPPARIWAIDEARIRLASRRYATDVILAGRLQVTTVPMTGNFIVLQGDKVHYFTVEAASQSAIANELIDYVADYLAGIYATVPYRDNERSLMLQVSNVADFADYAQLLAYLQNFTLIESLHLSQVKGDKLLFNVRISGDVERFIKTLALEKKLQLRHSGRSSSPLQASSVSPAVNGGDAADSMTLLTFEWL